MAIEGTLPVEETLQKIICKVTRNNNVVLNPAGTFKELGADSMDVVQIMVALEEALGIEIVDNELKSIPDMASFIEYLKGKVAERKRQSHAFYRSK
ncbi:MAG: acyl carrier protein [Dehalococcoidia bacterium]|nr:acyl carrier protein [Dehalococcoidia bacterium]